MEAEGTSSRAWTRSQTRLSPFAFRLSPRGSSAAAGVESQSGRTGQPLQAPQWKSASSADLKHTHTHIYIYMWVGVCVFVFFPFRGAPQNQSISSSLQNQASVFFGFFFWGGGTHTFDLPRAEAGVLLLTALQRRLQVMHLNQRWCLVRLYQPAWGRRQPVHKDKDV